MIVAIEGGGTKTRAWLARDGTVIAQASAGPANVHTRSTDELLTLVSGILDQLLTEAGVARTAVIALSLGMAGVGSPADRGKLEEVARRLGLGVPVSLESDAKATLVGATAGRGGVLLIAGTGSIAYGFVPDGAEARAGGWGYAVGDEGSGYRLGWEALVQITGMLDGRRRWTSLADLVSLELGLDGPAVLGSWIREHGAIPQDVARIAPAVCRAALEEDGVALRILQRGAVQLAGMVLSVCRTLRLPGSFQLVLYGGLLTRELYYQGMLREQLVGRLPRCRILVGDKDDGLRGCLALAKRANGS